MKKEEYKWQKYTAAWSKAKMVVVKQKNYIENVKKCRIIIKNRENIKNSWIHI